MTGTDTGARIRAHECARSVDDLEAVRSHLPLRQMTTHIACQRAILWRVRAPGCVSVARHRHTAEVCLAELPAQSARSASTGSTRVAERAGTRHATSATSAS